MTTRDRVHLQIRLYSNFLLPAFSVQTQLGQTTIFAAMPFSPDPQIESLIEEVHRNRGKLVATVNCIDQKLLEAGLAYKMQLCPEFVGVHPSNRNGYGLHDCSVQDLGAQICANGFSWAATAHACAMEDSAGVIATFSCKLAGASELLPEYIASNIKVGSLSCSHTNAFLLSAKQEVPSTIASISENGRISMAKVCRDDSAMREAIDKGLNWLIYKKEVGKMYPTWATMVQEARNKHLAQEENEVQLCMRIHEMARQLQRNDCVPWDDIVNRISSHHDVRALVNFCARWSGGQLGMHLAEMRDFHRNHVVGGRVIPSSTFAGLAALKLNAEDHCPYFICAVLKAQASCPENKVQQKLCRFITQGDVSSIQNRRLQTVLKAEEMLRNCRIILGNLPARPPRNTVTKLLGVLDCQVVRFVFEKSKDYRSLEDICHRFICDLQAALSANGIAETIANPFAATSSASVGSSMSSSEKQKPIANFIEYEHGTAVNINALVLNQNGYFVGTKVMHDDGAIAVIQSINNQGMVKLDNGISCDLNSFMDTYKVTNKSTTVQLTTWKSANESDSWALNNKIAMMQLGLAALDSVSTKDGICVQVKPKGVWTKRFFKKGSLKLTPLSSKIVAASAKASAASIVTQDMAICPQLSTERDDVIIPAWYVLTTCDQEAANIEIKYQKADLNVAVGKGSLASGFQVPMLVNSKDVDADTELLMYHEAENQKDTIKRKLGAVVTESIKKSQKIE